MKILCSIYVHCLRIPVGIKKTSARHFQVPDKPHLHHLHSSSFYTDPLLLITGGDRYGVNMTVLPWTYCFTKRIVTQ